MTRRSNRLTDADIGRLLAHMPDPPPPPADLTDRIVANAIAANATRPRRAPRRFGRRIWWVIAILGAAGAVTAAAANAGRFEFARVLQWPQEIARAAGWAPQYPHRPLLARAARATPPRLEAPVLAPTFAPGPRRLAPLAADHGERLARVGMPHLQRFAGADRIERPLRLLVRPHPEPRFADVHRRATASLAVANAHRAANHVAAARLLPPTVEPAQAATTHDDIERATKDDALRFQDADEYARRQASGDRDWRPGDNFARRALAGDRRWAADRGDRRWAADGDHRWAKPQGWERRAENRPFRPHPWRGRRRS